MELDKNSVLVVLVIAFLVVGAYVLLNYNQEQQVVTTQGSSEMTSQPDFVRVYVAVETLNGSAQEAKDANAEISNEVITELIKIGFERKDIETENFNIYEDFDWTESGRRSKGWKAINNLKIKVEDFSQTGKVVDIVVDSGALIQYISFELEKEHENELKAQVLEKASEDAKVKAEALARGSGKKLGNLVSISSQDYQYYPYRLYEASSTGDLAVAEAKSAVTNIQLKSLTVSAFVQASYKIK